MSKPLFVFIGYSHDDRPMFWFNDGNGLKIAYGKTVTEPLELRPGDKIIDGAKLVNK